MTFGEQLKDWSVALGSYAISASSWVIDANLNPVSVVTAVAGAVLTISIAYKNFHEGERTRLENKKMKRDDDNGIPRQGE